MDPSFVETHRLGTLQNAYGRARRFNLAGIVGPIFTGLLGIGITALILLAPSSGKGGDKLAGYVLAGLCYGIATLFIVLFLRQRDARVQVFSGGIAHTRAGKTRAFAWEEISEFLARITKVYVNGIPAGTQRRYTLKKANGESLVLTDVIANVEQIANRVMEETLRVQWPIVTRALDAGQPVQFGLYTVTREGITKGQSSLPWTAVLAAQVAHGAIKIWQPNTKRSWASVPYANVPNAHVFLALVDRLRAG